MEYKINYLFSKNRSRFSKSGRLTDLFSLMCNMRLTPFWSSKETLGFGLSLLCKVSSFSSMAPMRLFSRRWLQSRKREQTTKTATTNRPVRAVRFAGAAFISGWTDFLSMTSKLFCFAHDCQKEYALILNQYLANIWKSGLIDGFVDANVDFWTREMTTLSVN